MIQKIGNKLQVEIDAGGEKTKKITFTNVMDEPSEEKVLELGEIMKALSVEGSELDGGDPNQSITLYQINHRKEGKNAKTRRNL